MPGDHPNRADGFTLFEIAVSLAVVGVAITSLLLVFPVGLRAQQSARLGLLAAAKAEEMIDAYNTASCTNADTDVEAPSPWDVAVSRRSQAQDLESWLANPVFGIMPLPRTIANRLDSDGDEIAAILAAGGNVYYSQPMATTGVVESSLGDVIANQTQKLVFAVQGYAQMNALHIFPWKAWPYYTPFPSPPLHVRHNDAGTLPSNAVQVGWGPGYVWEAVDDPDAAVVYAQIEDGVGYGFSPYAYGTPSADGALRYLQAALWYCAKKGLPDSLTSPDATTPPLADFLPGIDVAAQVQGLRYLAHAAMCLTRWHDYAEMTAGVVVPSVVLAGAPSATTTATHARLSWWLESSTNLAMRFAASFPYDWRVPRPLQRPISMDCPLIEWDVFSPPLVGIIAGTALSGGPVTAHQWHAISAQPIRGLGVSQSYPAVHIPVNDPEDPQYRTDEGRADRPWGDASHFTLCRPFAPAERCRELVFWAADWQSYADAETAPSAPIDASRYNISAPHTGESFDQRMRSPAWVDVINFTFRNPEKNLLFLTRVDDRATGAAVSDAMIVGNIWSAADQGPSTEAKSAFTGRWGADRNFNRRIDRGPLPPSARLRAQTVERYLFYDMRVSNTIR